MMTPKGSEAVTPKEATQSETRFVEFSRLFSPPEEMEGYCGLLEKRLDAVAAKLIEGRKDSEWKALETKLQVYASFEEGLSNFLSKLVTENPSATEELTEFEDLLDRLSDIVTDVTQGKDKSVRIKRYTPGGREIIEEGKKGISFTSAKGEVSGTLAGEEITSVQVDIITDQATKKGKGKKGPNTPPPLIRINVYGGKKELASLTIRKQSEKSLQLEMRAGFLEKDANSKLSAKCAEALPRIQHAFILRLLSQDEENASRREYYQKQLLKDLGIGAHDYQQYLEKKAARESKAEAAEAEQLAQEEERARQEEQLEERIENLRNCEPPLKRLIEENPPLSGLVKIFRTELSADDDVSQERVLLAYLLGVRKPQQLVDKPERVVKDLGAAAALLPSLPNIVESTVLKRMEQAGDTDTPTSIMRNALRAIKEQIRSLKSLEEEDLS